MEFSNSSLSWTLGNALCSSFLDFFILDYELKPIYYTSGASYYLPSFLLKNGEEKLIFISETEKGFGVKQFQGKVQWHYGAINSDLKKEAINDIKSMN